MHTLLTIAALVAARPQAIVTLSGANFAGGAKDVYGALYFGEYGVNYVYAASTGAHSRMTAEFNTAAPAQQPMLLYIRARDSDSGAHSAIRIALNGKTVFEGPNEFPGDDWRVRKYPLPAGALVNGRNELAIECTEPEGRLGMPPWFMVAGCAIAPDGYEWGRRDIASDFAIGLPSEKRPFPEPLPEGAKPGFRVRGIKGWMWRPEQYLAEIPVLARYKMNFMMVCYTSMCDIEHYSWGDPRCNRWWEPLPPERKEAYARVVRACQRAGIQFCLSMNPGLCTERPIDYRSADDLEALWQHYAWMQSLGVRWFSVSLDDISTGIDASGQSALVNAVFARLKARDPQAKVIFCPTAYWGDGTDDWARPYLEILARELHPAVYLFWTGDAVVGHITRRAAESYKKVAQHRLIVWDNYPVNDAQQTLHLGPVLYRDADLCEVAEGYMSNSMCPQNEANRIPMLTCADYAYNPTDYDAERSIGQAILHLADTDEQRQTLVDLVEVYPGNLLFGGGTSHNPVRERIVKMADTPHSASVARAYVAFLEDLSARLRRAFPDRFRDAGSALARDIEWARKLMKARYGATS